MWLKFLGQCFDGDKDAEAKIKYIQEFVGIAMLGQGPKYQLATVLLGKGSNGKGVLCQVVQASMPPGSVCAIPPQDFGQEYRRARIAGKLLNVVSELPEREILDCESIKAMISGDLLTGREIRQAPFDFCPMAAHLFACNRLPNSADHTPGFWRRFAVITFNRVFEGEAKNPDLAEEIMAAELPAIVSWFLAGAQRVLNERRYTIPDSAVEAVANWKKDADVVQRFVDECCHSIMNWKISPARELGQRSSIRASNAGRSKTGIVQWQATYSEPEWHFEPQGRAHQDGELLSGNFGLMLQ